MIERPGLLQRALLGAAALAIISGDGRLAAQDAGSTAERARRAFSPSPGQPAQDEPAAQAQEEAEAAARSAAERLGVELISTSVLEAGGRRLIAARVMEPGSDSNVAFLVQTLVLDPESGDVLGVFPGTEDEIGALPGLAGQVPVPADEAETSGVE